MSTPFLDELSELCEKHHMTMGGGGDDEMLSVTFRRAPFAPGDEVVIEGHDTLLVNQMHTAPGGWVVEPPVEGFRCWNEDAMRRKA